MKERRKFEKSYLIVLGIISLFLLIGYSSYALFTVKKENKEAIRIVTGTLFGTLTSGDTSFHENKITVDANTKKEITIKLTNNNSIQAKLNFYYLDNISEKVHINYYKDTPNRPPTQEGVILEQGASESYHLRIYNLTNSSVTIEFRSDGGLANKELAFPKNGKTIEGIVVEVEEPASNMIPVVYSGGKWVKTSYNQENWYDYDKQEWANAVTVTPGTRASYQQAGNGTEVKMTDILQMWVWIPRYSYTIKSEDGEYYYGKKEEGRSDNPSLTLPGEIDVKFIDVSTTDNGSAQYKGEEPDGWYTPPGFTFGDKNLSGIWIGKFETSNIENCVAATVADAGCDLETLTSQIKPNVASWRDIRVSTLELVSMNITKSGNIYGFDQNTYDSHVTKDSEWALISYLTQSKYGKYGNPLYTGANKEIYKNNCNAYKTGCSSGLGTAEKSETCVYQYDDLVDRGSGLGYGGAGASTTGNITGIYDINGDSFEYTMGVLEKRSGWLTTMNSGYRGQLADDIPIEGREWPLEKYYDLYTTTDSNTACNGAPCKGYALNETAGWYGDGAVILTEILPWVARSGAYNASPSSFTGNFCHSHYTGGFDLNHSFRQVLTPLS